MVNRTMNMSTAKSEDVAQALQALHPLLPNTNYFLQSFGFVLIFLLLTLIYIRWRRRLSRTVPFSSMDALTIAWQDFQRHQDSHIFWNKAQILIKDLVPYSMSVYQIYGMDWRDKLQDLCPKVSLDALPWHDLYQPQFLLDAKSYLIFQQIIQDLETLKKN